MPKYVFFFISMSDPLLRKNLVDVTLKIDERAGIQKMASTRCLPSLSNNVTVMRLECWSYNKHRRFIIASLAFTLLHFLHWSAVSGDNVPTEEAMQHKNEEKKTSSLIYTVQVSKYSKENAFTMILVRPRRCTQCILMRKAERIQLFVYQKTSKGTFKGTICSHSKKTLLKPHAFTQLTSFANIYYIFQTTQAKTIPLNLRTAFILPNPLILFPGVCQMASWAWTNRKLTKTAFDFFRAEYTDPKINLVTNKSSPSLSHRPFSDLKAQRTLRRRKNSTPKGFGRRASGRHSCESNGRVATCLVSPRYLASVNDNTPSVTSTAAAVATLASVC